MGRSFDIVVLGSAPWATDAPLNCHHITRRLAVQHRVLYIEPTAMRTPNPLHPSDLAKMTRRLRSWAQRGTRPARNSHQPVEPQIWTIAPMMWPAPRLASLKQWNRRQLINATERAMKAIGMRQALLWSFLPAGIDLVGHASALGTIYHCVDDYAGNPGVNAAALREVERRMIKSADVCLATSAPLAQRVKRDGAKAVHCVPNVSEVERFESSDAPVPPELAELPRPRVGYVGNIAGYKVDIKLLATLARDRPDVSLVLIGGVGGGDPTTNVRPLRRLPNVHLLGARSHDELPAYVHGLDVCLIPFRRSSVTDCSLPLKTFEYLAAGKPVVSTPIAALTSEPLDDVLTYADSAADFAEAIDRLLRDNTPELISRRQAIARDYSWDRRFPQLHDIARQLVASRTAAAPVA
ncbi:glycosyltransferase [Phycisphaerales bacterium AB-hyl4]|uniref:Glycosyltransferase n=1 Tax=Natronomicrosphaera hydrolytica TaxID=3242702 RepID=A0ABV4U702_9BACT